MSDRTINFGESETEATYQIQDTDSTGGGNFVVAKDTNANTVLLQYDPDTDTWEYAGDVDINGGNVSGVGTLTADSVNTGDLVVDDHLSNRHWELVGEITEDIVGDSGTIVDGFGASRSLCLDISDVGASSEGDLYLQVDGIDDIPYNYHVVDQSANHSAITDDDHWTITKNNEGVAGLIELYRGRSDRPLLTANLFGTGGFSNLAGMGELITGGHNNLNGTDLSSVRLFTDAGDEVTVGRSIRVYRTR